MKSFNSFPPLRLAPVMLALLALLIDRSPAQTNVVPNPQVNIVSPTNGASFSAPADITITADVRDVGAYVNVIKFYDNSNLLASFILDPLVGASNGLVIPVSFTWTNVLAGKYALTVVATDTHGSSTTSAPVNIVVTNPLPVPTVTIVATDPTASINGDPGAFTVYRTGGTSQSMSNSLVVFYSIAGTASNGVDYDSLPGTVIIPAGAASAQITVTPIVDTNLDPPETVVLQLIPSPLAGPMSAPLLYVVGQPDTATVVITGNLSNLPPVVSIIATDPIAVEGTNFHCYPVAATVFSNYCSGTNTATFLIRRVGDTNTDLTVYYSIGGTASNGVDYVKIPDNVTIPAGKRFALVTIVPIEDVDPTARRFDTVILGLIEPPSTTPSNTLASLSIPVTLPYIIGFPDKAAAIILEDYDLHGPTPGPLPPCCFNVGLPGTNGTIYCLQMSTNMVDWTNLCTNLVVKDCIHFVDVGICDFPRRYYRAVTASALPVY